MFAQEHSDTYFLQIARSSSKASLSGLRKALAKPLHRLISPSKAILKDSTFVLKLAKPPSNQISLSYASTWAGAYALNALKRKC